MSKQKEEAGARAVEAGTLLNLARSNTQEPSTFRACISGFICLAYSTTELIRNNRPAGMPMEDARLKGATDRESALIRFFTGTRNKSMHNNLVEPTARTAANWLPLKVDGGANWGRLTVFYWTFDDTDEYGLEAHAPVLPLGDEYLTIVNRAIAALS